MRARPSAGETHTHVHPHGQIGSPWSQRRLLAEPFHLHEPDARSAVMAACQLDIQSADTPINFP
jgi:hypothetical protein